MTDVTANDWWICGKGDVFQHEGTPTHCPRCGTSASLRGPSTVLEAWNKPVEGRCNHEMLSGLCRMDEGHRGRHTTQVHYCDTCGKHRRGANAYSQMVNPWDDVVEAEQCWFCHQVMGPIWEREMYAQEMEIMRQEMNDAG